MKITQINAYPALVGGQTTAIDISVETKLPVAEALASLLALFADEQGIGGTGTREAMQAARNHVLNHPDWDTKTVEEIVKAAANKVANEPAKVTRTRRPRTNPDAAPATETAVVDQAVQEPTAGNPNGLGILIEAVDPPVTERRRTRVTAEAAAPEVKVITDADLAKAASNGAAQVGKEIIEIIMEELSVAIEWPVKSVSDIPTDKREWFLLQIDNEIAAAKEELAGAGK